MLKYELYCGEGVNGPVSVAVAVGEIGALDSVSGDVVKPEDYFKPDVRDVRKIGVIEMSGDIETLPTYWEFAS